MNKYRNKKVIVDGISFDSKRKQRDIRNCECSNVQESFPLYDYKCLLSLFRNKTGNVLVPIEPICI